MRLEYKEDGIIWFEVLMTGGHIDRSIRVQRVFEWDENNTPLRVKTILVANQNWLGTLNILELRDDFGPHDLHRFVRFLAWMQHEIAKQMEEPS